MTTLCVKKASAEDFVKKKFLRGRTFIYFFRKKLLMSSLILHSVALFCPFCDIFIIVTIIPNANNERNDITWTWKISSSSWFLEGCRVKFHSKRKKNDEMSFVHSFSLLYSFAAGYSLKSPTYFLFNFLKWKTFN